MGNGQLAMINKMLNINTYKYLRKIKDRFSISYYLMRGPLEWQR
jgi:hypothetical protein